MANKIHFRCVDHWNISVVVEKEFDLYDKKGADDVSKPTQITSRIVIFLLFSRGDICAYRTSFCLTDACA